MTSSRKPLRMLQLALMAAAVAVPAAGAMARDCERWVAVESARDEHTARQRAIYAVNIEFNEWKADVLPRFGTAASLNRAINRGELWTDVRCWGRYTCKAVKTWCD